MSGITDEKALDEVLRAVRIADAGRPGGGLSLRIAHRHIAARLRGDGEQGQVVACSECGAKSQAEAEGMCIAGGDKDDCHGNELWPDDDLRPQPVAVAGDAVRGLPAKWREEAYPITGTKALRLAECADELEAALSTQPAPSGQVAASVAVPEGMVLIQKRDAATLVNHAKHSPASALAARRVSATLTALRSDAEGEG